MWRSPAESHTAYMRWTEARSWDRASLEASARTAARSTSVAGLIVFAPAGAPVPPVPAVSNGVESRGEAVSPLDEPVGASVTCASAGVEASSVAGSRPAGSCGAGPSGFSLTCSRTCSRTCSV